MINNYYGNFDLNKRIASAFKKRISYNKDFKNDTINFLRELSKQANDLEVFNEYLIVNKFFEDRGFGVSKFNGQQVTYYYKTNEGIFEITYWYKNTISCAFQKYEVLSEDGFAGIQEENGGVLRSDSIEGLIERIILVDRIDKILLEDGLQAS
jgi:hypothetical protein